MRERRRVASWGNLDVAAGGDETSGGGPNNIELEFIERTSPRARDLAAARSAAAAAAAEAERGVTKTATTKTMNTSDENTAVLTTAASPPCARATGGRAGVVFVSGRMTMCVCVCVCKRRAVCVL